MSIRFPTVRSLWQGPFPYDDCWKVLGEETDQYEDFIPDLNTYFHAIWSHWSGVEKVLRLPNDRLLTSQKFIGQTFWENFPKYGPLKDRVTENTTPRLHERLEICDELGRTLAISSRCC